MASDGETKDVSSSQIQPTEPMEISGGVASSLLGKRKVETTNTEDPDESEGDKENVDNEEEEESDSDWDKDSFDGREYNPADDDGEYWDKELEKKIRFFNRTVIETKGFFESSDDFPLCLWSGIGIIRNLEAKVKDMTCREFLAQMTARCVEKYNRRKGKNLKFEHIVRANFNPGGRTKYYMTFAARESESPDAPLVEYQAKAVWCAGVTYPILCRPSPPPKTGDGLKEIAKVMEESS